MLPGAGSIATDRKARGHTRPLLAAATSPRPRPCRKTTAPFKSASDAKKPQIDDEKAKSRHVL